MPNMIEIDQVEQKRHESVLDSSLQVIYMGNSFRDLRDRP